MLEKVMFCLGVLYSSLATPAEDVPNRMWMNVQPIESSYIANFPEPFGRVVTTIRESTEAKLESITVSWVSTTISLDGFALDLMDVEDLAFSYEYVPGNELTEIDVLNITAFFGLGEIVSNIRVRDTVQFKVTKDGQITYHIGDQISVAKEYAAEQQTQQELRKRRDSPEEK